ncbi:S-layer homology domain-containing protein [Paenibacillus sp. LjRoot153]|uniref:S-layer homology domain-containing protein n=1 Tax=Paenibacillus sp. LjRoot153 TaxID=3342270 RepID=UPI003ECD7D11
MNKQLALFLSLLLFCYCLTPLAYAEEASSQNAKTTATPSTATTPATSTTTTAPSATVTSDTYLADQLADLKSSTKDDKKKITSLLKIEAIETASADSFGANQQITRAQVAKAVAIILGLRIDNTHTTSSFSDVKSDDLARVYIEALKNSGLTYDAGDKFLPTGQMSRQELAKLLLKGLGLDEKVKQATPTKDETVDNTYKSYVAYAVQQKLMTNQVDGKFGGNVPVTKKEFALIAYAALQLHLTTAKPEKASIAELKVIGKNKMTVRLNRDVDINKAVLTVTKEGALDSDNKPVIFTGGTDWTDDNTTAKLDMDDPFTFGTYLVTLSGVDVSDGEINFSPDNERVTKLEIVTATEKLSKSKTLIEYKATNQYGEKMLLSASNANIIVSGQKKVTPAVFSSNSIIGLDLSDIASDSTITVVILERSGYTSVSKTFTVGDPPLVKKIDLGDTKNNLKLPIGQLSFKAGEKAYLSFKAFDQYGNRIIDPLYLNMGIGRSFTGAFGNVLRNEGINDFIDFENDGYPELQLIAYPNLDSDKEVIVTLFCEGQKVSQTITIKTPKTPSTIKIGPLTNPMTEGDTNISINLKVVDSANYELTATERADLLTTGKIMIYASGGLVLANPVINSTGSIIVQQATGAGPASINVRINGLDQTISFPINIMAARKPDSIKVDLNSSAPNVLALNGINPKFSSSGATTTTAKAQFIIYDQTGTEYKTNRTDYKVQLKLEKISGDTGAIINTTGAVSLSDASPTALKGVGEISTTGITFNPSKTLSGSYKLTASVVQVDSGGQALETLSTDSVTVDVKNITNANLTYSVEMSSSGDLFAIQRTLYDNAVAATVTDITYLMTDYSMFTQTAVIKVKDGSSVDAFSITPKAVTSDNPKVIGARGNKIIGLDTGKTNLTVWYDSPLGGIQKLTIAKGANADTLIITEIKTNGTPTTITGDPLTKLNGKYIWDSSLLGKLQSTTNYGTVNLHTATYLLGFAGVQAFISDQVYADGTTTAQQDSITVNPDFTLTYTQKGSASNMKQFTIYVVAGTYSKSFVVNLQ